LLTSRIQGLLQIQAFDPKSLSRSITARFLFLKQILGLIPLVSCHDPHSQLFADQLKHNPTQAQGRAIGSKPKWNNE
jgi:hypothetical protein